MTPIKGGISMVKTDGAAPFGVSQIAGHIRGNDMGKKGMIREKARQPAITVEQ